jgi:hypothetical protein
MILDNSLHVLPAIIAVIVIASQIVGEIIVSLIELGGEVVVLLPAVGSDGALQVAGQLALDLIVVDQSIIVVIDLCSGVAGIRSGWRWLNGCLLAD